MTAEISRKVEASDKLQGEVKIARNEAIAVAQAITEGNGLGYALGFTVCDKPELGRYYSGLFARNLAKGVLEIKLESLSGETNFWNSLRAGINGRPTIDYQKIVIGHSLDLQSGEVDKEMAQLVAQAEISGDNLTVRRINAIKVSATELSVLLKDRGGIKGQYAFDLPRLDPGEILFWKKRCSLPILPEVNSAAQ
jgi:hypothetical protein